MKKLRNTKVNQVPVDYAKGILSIKGVKGTVVLFIAFIFAQI